MAPWIVTRDTAREIEFLTAAFDGEELGRTHSEDGSIVHGEVRIGDFIVLLFDAKANWPDTPALLRLQVLGLAVALPAHYPYGFDTIGHLGLIYLATAIFVAGALLSLKVLGEARR